MKKRKILLCRIETNKLCNLLIEKTIFENVLTYYEIAVFFNLKNLSKDFLGYIERFFTVVVETGNFLHLSFFVLYKILSSSLLDITSELEISDAVDKWLGYNYKDRRVFASKLLQKVRLSLISDNSLKCILHESSAIRRDDKCVKLLRNALEGDSKHLQGKLTTRYRYCDQDKFNILVCGGHNGLSYTKNVHEVDGKNLKQYIVNRFQLTESCAVLKTVYLRGEVYFFFGNSTYRFLISLDKYSILDKTWQSVSYEGVMHQYFCVANFGQLVRHIKEKW